MKTLAERAKSARKEAKLTQKEAAKKIGIKQPSLSGIETGDTKAIDANTLIGMARAYNVNPEWLNTGQQKLKVAESQGLYNQKSDDYVEIQKKTKPVPLINMVAAGNWSEVADPYPVGEAEEWLDCPVKHGTNTFAVKINGESMLPKFQHGEIIFCDPNAHAENKDYIIAKLTDENQATFKQLVIEGGQQLLKAINPNWPVQYVPINGNCEIVGKVIARLEKL